MRHLPLPLLVACALAGCNRPAFDLSVSNLASVGRSVGGSLTVTVDGHTIQSDDETITLTLETRSADGDWEEVPEMSADFGGPENLDLMVVVDNSGSVDGTQDAVNAALRDVADAVFDTDGNRMGLVRVSTEAEVWHPLTDDPAALDTSIGDLFVTNGWTALWDGLRQANEQISAEGILTVSTDLDVCVNTRRFAVMGFTDGADNNSADQHPTAYAGDGVDTTIDDLLVLDAGATTPVHLTGIGTEIDADALQQVADGTGGTYTAIDDYGQITESLLDTVEVLADQIPFCLAVADCSHTEGRATVTIEHLDGTLETETLEFTLPECVELEPEDVGLLAGHFDLDTASEIADVGNGDTDGHVHEYDDKYDVTGADYFDLHDDKLHEITEDIADGTQAFKLIVANADLSPGARLVINQGYDGGDPTTWQAAPAYDDLGLDDLTVYSLDGVAGTVALTQLGIYFPVDAITQDELHPTKTGCVRDNDLGPDGEWRNGALTIQAVAVAADGTHDFAVNPAFSNGGVQGVATSGLLWESTLFWHWDGPCHHDEDWATHEPD